MMIRLRTFGATAATGDGGAGGAASIISGSGSASQAARLENPGFLARFFGVLRGAGTSISLVAAGLLGAAKIASAASNAEP